MNDSKQALLLERARDCIELAADLEDSEHGREFLRSLAQMVTIVKTTIEANDGIEEGPRP